MLLTTRKLQGICTESVKEQIIYQYCGVLMPAAWDANKYIDK